MAIQIGQKFVKLSYLTVTDYNEKTDIVTCTNDAGAEVFITAKLLRELYSEDNNPRFPYQIMR